MKFLLDAGHGGMAFGHYLTKGKRSPSVPPGIYEGEFNRAICADIAWDRPINTLFINPGPVNIPLSARVKFINELAKLEDCVLLSIHANAAGKPGWSRANGFVVFRPRKPLIKTKFANERYENSIVLSKRMVESMSEIGDIKKKGYGTKEANFTIIKSVKCPAILVECGFMTNKEEASILSSILIRRKIVFRIVKAMNAYKEWKM